MVASMSHRIQLACFVVLVAIAASASAADTNPHAPTALELAKPGMQAIAPDVWTAQVAEGTWVLSFTHLLEGTTVYPANGLAVDTPEGAVLVDPGWEPAQTEAILQWARTALKHPVKTAIVTHSHEDRSAGIAVLAKAGIPSFGLAKTAEILKGKGMPGLKPLPKLDTRPWTGPGKLEVRYPGPGHAPDNLVVWVPSAKLLYGGCLVKSVTAQGLGNVADADVKAWPGSIKRLQAAYPHAAIVVPGHGTLEGDSLGHTLKLLAP